MKGLVIRARLSASDVYHQGTSILDLFSDVGGAAGVALVLPAQINTPSYDGTEHAPELDSFDPRYMTLGGMLSGTAAGAYEATVTPKPGCWWADSRTRDPRAVTWRIAAVKVDPPTVRNDRLTYDGNEQAAPIACSDVVTLIGDVSATNAGSYTAYASLPDNYEWRDGSTGTIPLTWSIVRKKIPQPTVTGAITYTGSELPAPIAGFDAASMTVKGMQSATDAGRYTLTYTLLPNHEWADGTVDPIVLTWEIAPIRLPRVTLATTSYNYSGETIRPVFANAASGGVTASGDMSAVNAGEYTAHFAPAANYTWADGGTDTISISWTVGALSVAIPAQSGSLTYNGAEQQPTISYSEVSVALSGPLAKTNAGTYEVVASLKPNYVWSDGTTEPKKISWTIKPKVVDRLPAILRPVEYIGSEIPLVLDDAYDPAFMTVSGDTVAVDAGIYLVTIVLDENHVWADSIVSEDPGSVPVPTLHSELIYTGAEVVPVWDGFNASYTKISGDTSAVDSCEYQVCFELDNKHIFESERG